LALSLVAARSSPAGEALGLASTPYPAFSEAADSSVVLAADCLVAAALAADPGRATLPTRAPDKLLVIDQQLLSSLQQGGFAAVCTPSVQPCGLAIDQSEPEVDPAWLGDVATRRLRRLWPLLARELGLGTDAPTALCRARRAWHDFERSLATLAARRASPEGAATLREAIGIDRLGRFDQLVCQLDPGRSRLTDGEPCLKLRSLQDRREIDAFATAVEISVAAAYDPGDLDEIIRAADTLQPSDEPKVVPPPSRFVQVMGAGLGHCLLGRVEPEGADPTRTETLVLELALLRDASAPPSRCEDVARLGADGPEVAAFIATGVRYRGILRRADGLVMPRAGPMTTRDEELGVGTALLRALGLVEPFIIEVTRIDTSAGWPDKPLELRLKVRVGLPGVGALATATLVIGGPLADDGAAPADPRQLVSRLLDGAIDQLQRVGGDWRAELLPDGSPVRIAIEGIEIVREGAGPPRFMGRLVVCEIQDTGCPILVTTRVGILPPTGGDDKAPWRPVAAALPQVGTEPLVERLKRETEAPIRAHLSSGDADRLLKTLLVEQISVTSPGEKPVIKVTALLQPPSVIAATLPVELLIGADGIVLKINPTDLDALSREIARWGTASWSAAIGQRLNKLDGQIVFLGGLKFFIKLSNGQIALESEPLGTLGQLEIRNVTVLNPEPLRLDFTTAEFRLDGRPLEAASLVRALAEGAGLPKSLKTHLTVLDSQWTADGLSLSMQATDIPVLGTVSLGTLKLAHNGVSFNNALKESLSKGFLELAKARIGTFDLGVVRNIRVHKIPLDDMTWLLLIGDVVFYQRTYPVQLRVGPNGIVSELPNASAIAEELIKEVLPDDLLGGLLDFDLVSIRRVVPGIRPPRLDVEAVVKIAGAPLPLPTIIISENKVDFGQIPAVPVPTPLPLGPLVAYEGFLLRIADLERAKIGLEANFHLAPPAPPYSIVFSVNAELDAGRAVLVYNGTGKLFVIPLHEVNSPLTKSGFADSLRLRPCGDAHGAGATG
jgi:hypothetical protein